MTKTIHGLRPYVTDATSYHGERPYPPSYLAALLQEILGHMPQPVGLTRDQKLAEFLGLPQAAFSSYKRASALMPFEIAAKLQGFEVDMPVRLSDEAILAWHEADTKHRAEWRRMSHRVSAIKGSATKRARRLEASKKATEAAPKPAFAAAPAVQPVRIYPAVTMVEQPSVNPIVTYQDAISHTGASQRAEAWIRRVFGIAGSFKEASHTKRIVAIDFEGLHSDLVNFLLEETA